MVYVTLIDRLGRIVWVSEFVADVEPHTVVGRPVWEHAPDPHVLQGQFLRCLTGEHFVSYAEFCFGGDPHGFRVEWYPSPELTEIGCVLKARPIDVRVTRLTEHQRALLRAVAAAGTDHSALAETLELSRTAFVKAKHRIRKRLGLMPRSSLVEIATALYGDV